MPTGPTGLLLGLSFPIRSPKHCPPACSLRRHLLNYIMRNLAYFIQINVAINEARARPVSDTERRLVLLIAFIKSSQMCYLKELYWWQKLAHFWGHFGRHLTQRPVACPRACSESSSYSLPSCASIHITDILIIMYMTRQGQSHGPHPSLPYCGPLAHASVRSLNYTSAAMHVGVPLRNTCILELHAYTMGMHQHQRCTAINHCNSRRS